MKKLLAILLSLTLVLLLCACESAEPNDTPDTNQSQNQTDTQDPETIAEPEPPIEVSEFAPNEDMPEPFADGAENADFTSEAAGVTVGERAFTLEWIYYHNIHDWVKAGITYDDGVNLAEVFINLGLTDQAWKAVKEKISDFTMIVMWESDSIDGAALPSITVGDEVYDLAWLSSHNATEYKEAGIPAATVKDYLDVLRDKYWYTSEFRWMEIVYDRMVNGF